MQLSPEERNRVRDEVTEACKPIAQSWPMKTFAYRNPLRGWEHLPFDEAIREAKHLLGGNGYIPNNDYRQLYREGRITEDAVEQALQAVASSIGTPTVTVGDRQVAASDVLRLHLVFGFWPLDPALDGLNTKFQYELVQLTPRTSYEFIFKLYKHPNVGRPGGFQPTIRAANKHNIAQARLRGLKAVIVRWEDRASEV